MPTDAGKVKYKVKDLSISNSERSTFNSDKNLNKQHSTEFSESISRKRSSSKLEQLSSALAPKPNEPSCQTITKKRKDTQNIKELQSNDFIESENIKKEELNSYINLSRESVKQDASVSKTSDTDFNRTTVNFNAFGNGYNQFNGSPLSLPGMLCYLFKVLKKI